MKNRSQLLKFLKGRPDLDRSRILRVANFSQTFARQQFLNSIDAPSTSLHPSSKSQATDSSSASIEPLPSQRVDAASAREDNTPANLPEEKPRAAGDGAQSVDINPPSSTKPAVDTSRDEDIARAMQAAFDDEVGFSLLAGNAGEGGSAMQDEEDEDEEFSDYDVGEVAAGGWRMREAAHDEEMALEEDVECLELREVRPGPALCLSLLISPSLSPPRSPSFPSPTPVPLRSSFPPISSYPRTPRSRIASRFGGDGAPGAGGGGGGEPSMPDLPGGRCGG